MEDHKKEKIESDLNRLKLHADIANSRMNNFQDDLAAAVTDVAFKHFAGFKNMEAEEIRSFGKLVSKHTWSLTTDLDSLHYQLGG